MKFKENAFVNFFNKNLWLTFGLNINAVIQIIMNGLNRILEINLSDKLNFTELEYTDLVIFIASILIYVMFKYLIRVLSYVSEVTTNNLNDSHRILSTKIHYLSFYMENKNLDDDSYIKKLHDSGFSKDDLEEMGISDDFIKKNNDKLLPRNIINKWNDLKSELNKHHKKQNEPTKTT